LRRAALDERYPQFRLADGGIYRYEFVAAAVMDALMRAVAGAAR
jgi:hypothetical protein